MRSLALIGIAAAAWLLAAPSARPQPAQQRTVAQPVDLELVLAVDASGSIDEDEMRLQRQGYAEAFINERVLRAIRSGYHRSITVMYLEWAAVGCERISVDWTRLTDAASAQAFAAAIMAAPRHYCPGGNAIGDAIAFAAANMVSNGFRGERLVIDVSGDGPNTLGRPVVPARDAAVAQGITINGLAIIRSSSWFGRGLTDHYRESIIGGPGAFVVEAEKGENFAEAVLNKLVREIAAVGARHGRE